MQVYVQTCTGVSIIILVCECLCVYTLSDPVWLCKCVNTDCNTYNRPVLVQSVQIFCMCVCSWVRGWRWGEGAERNLILKHRHRPAWSVAKDKGNTAFLSCHHTHTHTHTHMTLLWESSNCVNPLIYIWSQFGEKKLQHSWKKQQNKLYQRLNCYGRTTNVCWTRVCWCTKINLCWWYSQGSQLH